MKLLPIVILTILIACSPAQTKKDEAQTDTLQAETTTTNNTTTGGAEAPTEKIISFNPNDTTQQEVFLQWYEVNYSDYGPSYVFKDRKGEQLRIRIIEIPGWDFEKNDYLDVTYPTDNIFPIITIKDDAINKWYKATIKMETRELDGVGADFPILKSLEIAYSFE